MRQLQEFKLTPDDFKVHWTKIATGERKVVPQLSFKTLLRGSMNAETKTDIPLCCRNKSDRHAPRMIPAHARKSSSGFSRRIDECRVDLRSTQEQSI
ncbi:hypothetical protein NL676_004921 [Syzygium grande]|nr:hypothetical protein NL676_004921 [Syzygium grande]